MRRGNKAFNALKFGTSIGRFWSDSAASMAVKGLRTIRDGGPRRPPRLSLTQLVPELCSKKMMKCCFTSTETLLGTGAHDGHLDFH